MEMVFNELSLLSQAQSIPQARQRMTQFISSIAAVTSQGVSRVLRTDIDFQVKDIAPSYSLLQWRNDNEVRREERQFLRSLTTKAPYLEGLPQLQDATLTSQFFYKDSQESFPTLGFGYAYLLDALAISLSSEERWNYASIQFEHQWLETDEDVLSEQVTVQHCCHPSHVVTHRDWITNQLQKSVQNGADLWNRRDTLFSALSFCDSAAKTLQLLTGADSTFRQVIKRLFDLEGYCKDWLEGGFDHNKLPSKVSPESEATLNQYGRERTFTCPDGVNRVFSWHVRLTPLAWRIHFFPDPAARQIIIGYVGPHLPTVNNPT
jgi:hypothetical protein